MGIAYSQQAQIYKQIRNDTAAHLIADFDAAVAEAGWTNKTAISGGWKYSLLSPQGLTCKVKVWDNGGLSGQAISIQFLSNDELSVGLEHHLFFGVPAYTSLGYQLIVGYTQIFISLPGISDTGVIAKFAHSFAGGIPRIPDGSAVDCTAETPGAITQTWWSCGSGDEAFGVKENFRSSLWCNVYYSYNLNGIVHIPVSSDGPQTGPLQIYTMKPTYNTEISLPPLTVLYGSNRPLDLDAFIGWTGGIHGQLWDAFLRTNAQTVDLHISTTEVDSNGVSYVVHWISYNSTTWGSLFLRIQEPAPTVDDGWNYAY